MCDHFTKDKQRTEKLQTEHLCKYMYMYVVRVIMEESLRITPHLHCKANVELNLYDLEQKRQHNLSYIHCTLFRV